MIPEIGQFALTIALLLALTQATLPLIGASRGNRTWIALAVPAGQAQFVFVTIAFGCLAYSFITNDFSVLNVATNSNSQLPLHYRLAATWGSHEGSLLLWALMLALWTAAVTLFSRHLPEEMVARVISVMGIISVGFLLFMLLTSNPFTRLFPVPPDGRDLNPLLQDPGMVAHPPMLYMGYVGFSVAFAFAIAALIGGRLDATWARWSRPWTTVAWMFLTCGIALGSFWAYYELGWGGWWFWDPVENASFMPWLVGTALIHSLAVTEKRGGFKSWTVLLAIAAFSLSLLGTFLVRSGVLTSVHAFASDPKRGVFILAFLVIVIGGSLFLYAWRARQVGLGGKFDLALTRIVPVVEQCAADSRGRIRAARDALPVDRRIARHGHALCWSTLFQSCIRASHGAGDVPDGYWTTGALEESEPAGSCDKTTLGFCHQRAERSDVAVPVRTVEVARELWFAAGDLDRLHSNCKHLGKSSSHVRTAHHVSKTAHAES